MTIEKADWLFESDGFYLKFKVKNREEGQRIVAEVNSSDKPYELTVEKKKRKRRKKRCHITAGIKMTLSGCLGKITFKER